MSLDFTLRCPKSVRDQLIWLKRQTGLSHYHTLCRWALCLSVADPRPVRLIGTEVDSAESEGELFAEGESKSFELPWYRLGQRDADILADILRARAISEGMEPTREVLQKLALAHIERGLARMMARKRIRSIADLVQLAPTHEPVEISHNSAVENSDSAD